MKQSLLDYFVEHHIAPAMELLAIGFLCEVHFTFIVSNQSFD
jgi:hypothetical protein